MFLSLVRLTGAFSLVSFCPGGYQRGMPQLSKFLHDTPEDARRRRERKRRRDAPREPKRAKTGAKATSHKRKRLPCCGKERRHCACDAEVGSMLKGRAVDALVRDIMSTDVLTARDPKDMAYILEKLRGQSMTPHRFMFHVVLFRMYSKDSTYDVLSKHVGACQPGRQSPDWTGMTKALASLYRAPEAVWGGMFYPATLRSVRLRSGRWKKFSNVTEGGAAQPAMQANRDMHAFKMVWKALEADDTLTKYFMRRKVLATDTSKNTVLQAREAFAAWYDSFYNYISNNTKCWWGTIR